MKIALKSGCKVSQVLILILLFLGSMNAANLCFYFLFAAFLISALLHMRRLKVDGWVVGLLLFTVCYIVLYPAGSGSLTAIVKHFIYPACYILGLNFIDYNADKPQQDTVNDRLLYTALIIPPLGAFAHYVLNMVMNFSSLSRNTVDIWTGEIIVATGQASLAVMALGLFAAWLFSTSKKMVKVLAAVGVVVTFLYNLVLAGRTLILLSVLVLAVAFFYAIKTSRIRRRFAIVFASVLILLFVLGLYINNAFGMRDWILGSNLSMRFDTMLLGEDSRVENKLLYFKYMLDYPFGGGGLRKEVGGYAHELYLDVYSDVGIIGYVLVIWFVVDAAVKSFKLIKGDTVSNNFKIVLLCILVTLLAEFFIEPIIRSIPWMFYTLCFYSGLLKSKIQYDHQSARCNA